MALKNIPASEDSATSRRWFLLASATAAASAAVIGGCTNESQSVSSAGNAVRPDNAALTRKLTSSVPLNPKWPVLSRYSGEYVSKVAMPMGGVGTGCISLGGRGQSRDWEVVNRPAYGYQPINTFFALWTEDAAGKTTTRCLEGALPKSEFEGWSGSPAANHSLPRFRECSFAAAYPLGQVLLSDPTVPLQVRIEGFNPLIPADADSSGMPAAIVRFVLINPTNAPIDAAVCGTVENFIGWDGDEGKAIKGVNERRDETAPELHGLFMESKGVDPKNPAWGTLALATTTPTFTFRRDWATVGWGDSLLDFWDDLSDDGKLQDQEPKHREAPFASLAPYVTVPANGQKVVTFLISWHFPNRMTWNNPVVKVGNYYCTQYADAWAAAVTAAKKLDELEQKTVQFVQAIVDSDIPAPIKDACLANASTLRTQTAFRTEDGHFFGWEGCEDKDGSCYGSCTHVWNYEQTTPFLFGLLSKDARYSNFAHATDERGLMSFRMELPLARASASKDAAADGQMGTIMRLYRDWRLSGDEQFLKDLYPGAKRALEFAWIPGGWDADKDGVMEGCQHNTMDVEYYGPNPEIGVWYLGALRAMEEMSRFVGENEFADTCHDLFARGSKWFDENLFNGDYYEQKIGWMDPDKIAPGLLAYGHKVTAGDPVLQIGAGCLGDQLVGQAMAHVCSLGYLLDEKNVRKTMQSIMQFNFREEFYDHFNHLRSYALGDDKGLLIATYPRGGRPKRPFPYSNEVWSGIEYCAATGMIYENQLDDALRIVSAARDRHDGQRRNPFDEEECGHHYARAMAAWGCLLAFTGFDYDGIKKTMRFAPSVKPAKWFFSTGYAWGTFSQDGSKLSLDVLHGSVAVQKLSIGDRTIELKSTREVSPGNPLQINGTQAV